MKGTNMNRLDGIVADNPNIIIFGESIPGRQGTGMTSMLQAILQHKEDIEKRTSEISNELNLGQVGRTTNE